ncbi:hypothetical protein DITRI_Ditri16bG0086100 [Diplodiscus trichospermus]
MEGISEEQKNIREGQRQVREKFEAIESECEELKRETRTIIQQSARTQIKLAIMFQIIKSSQQADFATVAKLTRLLRLVKFPVQNCQPQNKIVFLKFMPENPRVFSHSLPPSKYKDSAAFTKLIELYLTSLVEIVGRENEERQALGDI